MQKEKQDKFRAELIDSYEKRAWESLANYNYFGRQYEEIEKQVKDMENKIEVANTDIRNIHSQLDYHTVENKEKVKGLKRDIELYTKRIKSVEAVHKKMFEESTAWREQGVKFLEQAENFKTFKVKTEEEIAEAKKGETQTSDPVAK